VNLALIGYRGTGKTEVAEIIARRTGLELIGLDAAIVEKAGASIPDVVERRGWDHFRDLESEVLAEAAAGDNRVLDCGGGIIIRENNREKLRAAGPVVWLTATVPTIIGRIEEDLNRPSLTGKSFTDEVAEVLEEREPLYRDCANHAVATDEITPDQVAEKIIGLVGL